MPKVNKRKPHPTTGIEYIPTSLTADPDAIEARDEIHTALVQGDTNPRDDSFVNIVYLTVNVQVTEVGNGVQRTKMPRGNGVGTYVVTGALLPIKSDGNGGGTGSRLFKVDLAPKQDAGSVTVIAFGQGWSECDRVDVGAQFPKGR